jgi:hypothetical protein
MEDGVCQWSKFMVRLPWSDLIKNLVLRAMGPSLGVNQMWTKRKDHGAKSGGGDFFNICTKMAVFKRMVVFR